MGYYTVATYCPDGMVEYPKFCQQEILTFFTILMSHPVETALHNEDASLLAYLSACENLAIPCLAPLKMPVKGCPPRSRHSTRPTTPTEWMIFFRPRGSSSPTSNSSQPNTVLGKTFARNTGPKLIHVHGCNNVLAEVVSNSSNKLL